MPITTQNTTQRGARGRGGYGGRGRGRGRGGRYGNKRHYNKKRNDNNPVEKKAPIERCPYIVGTPQWCKWKEARYPPSNIYVGEPIDPSFIPRISSVDEERENLDNKIAYLQQEMIDNRWSLREDDIGEYFHHDLYTGKRVVVHEHIGTDGRIYKLPLIDKEDDIEGLGCSFTYKAPSLYCTIDLNRFIEYGESRTGKRREAYLKYLARRLKKKEVFEREAKEAAILAEKNRRQTNKTISSV